MCFQPFNKLLHWGPIAGLGIIKYAVGSTVYFTSLWWPPTTLGGIINTYTFLALSVLALYNYMAAMLDGPGFLPLNWKPEEEDVTDKLQWCKMCKGYKAPRVHHCTKCGRCVLKMDHHCPWLNNCVGWRNHGHFTAFLFYSIVGSLHSCVILSCTLYRGMHRAWYYRRYYGGPLINLNMTKLAFLLIALGLVVGVVLGIGVLFFKQVQGLFRNRTLIEDWILYKAQHRRRNSQTPFIYPYHLGMWKNFRQVVNISCDAVGDGIVWPVADGCDQYTLTVEQLAQKAEKLKRSRVYTIVRASSHYWFPVTQGLTVCINFPCTDEPRLELAPGDKVLVTRWKKHWLFGEKLKKHLADELDEPNMPLRLKGWFPRRCAASCADGSENSRREKATDCAKSNGGIGNTVAL